MVSEKGPIWYISFKVFLYGNIDGLDFLINHWCNIFNQPPNCWIALLDQLRRGEAKRSIFVFICGVYKSHFCICLLCTNETLTCLHECATAALIVLLCWCHGRQCWQGISCYHLDCPATGATLRGASAPPEVWHGHTQTDTLGGSLEYRCRKGREGALCYAAV